MKQEFKRFISRPLIYVLLAGCMIVNGWILLNHINERAIVLAAAGLLEEWENEGNVGNTDKAVYVTEENLQAIKSQLEKNMPDASLQENADVSLENLLKGTVVMARTVTSKDLASGFIESAGLFGGAAAKASEICGSLSGLFEKLNESGIANRFFVPCHLGFFDMFCRELFPALAFEGILLCVLLMLRAANDTFSAKTVLVVFATKQGRKNQWSCFAGAMAGCALMLAVLWGLTLGAAAVCYPIGNLWNTPLGSCMILSQLFPVVARFPMTVLGYMAAEFFVALLLGLLFAAAAFGLSELWHNSFKVFIVMVFAGMVLALVPSFAKGSKAWFVLNYNPVNLAGNAGFWFASGKAWVAPAHYELITFLVWGLLAAILVFFMTRRFYKEDILS